MNFGKLLGTGKTFFGGSDAVAYRLNKRVALPQFNVGKNPFAPKPAEPAPVAAPEVKKVSAPVVATAATAQKVLAKPAVRPTRAGWTTKLNPFRAPAPVALSAHRAEQPELSLDAVKVMHNDLADADIEIVPVKAHAAAPVAAPVLPPARQAWEYLGESLMKSS